MELPLRFPPASFFVEASTPQGQSRWLTRCFGAYSFADAPGGVSLWLPHAYTFDMHPQDAATFNPDAHEAARRAGQLPPLRFQPVRIEVTSPTKDEAVSKIFEIAHSGEFFLYKNKPGQKEEKIVDPTQYYAMIYEEDPRHSHEPDSHLIDFIKAQAYAGGVAKGMFEPGSPTHSHLLLS